MGLFHRRHEAVAPPGQVWTACPPGLEMNARNNNISAPLPEELEIVLVEDQDYYKTHGTLPPLIDPGANMYDIRERIEYIRKLAETTQDIDEATRYINEIGYLQDKLNRGL